MAADQESLSITGKGSKGLIAIVLSMFMGGGLGAGAYGLSQGRDATEQPTPWLSRTETEGLANTAANRAEERAQAFAVAQAAKAEQSAKEACDTKLLDIHVKLKKLDSIAEDVASIKTAIQFLQNRKGR